MFTFFLENNDADTISGYTDYLNVKLSSLIKKDNILGVQFHPEKSHKYGMKFFEKLFQIFSELKFNRIIPVLLLDGFDFIKTQKFKSKVYLGDPLNALKVFIFNDKYVDELILVNKGHQVKLILNSKISSGGMFHAPFVRRWNFYIKRCFDHNQFWF